MPSRSAFPFSLLRPLLPAAAALALLITSALPPAHAAEPAAPGRVVVSGAVPDEATRTAIVAKLRGLYGAERVVDQLVVDNVVAPANWSQHVQDLITPALQSVNHGRIQVRGQDVDIQGEVISDTERQRVNSSLAAALNPTYTVKQELRVAASEQALIDRLLANRIVEFEAGSAVLRPQGAALLDELAKLLSQMGTKPVEIIGHTDSAGSRDANVALSLARADAVLSYLVAKKGLPATRLRSAGAGPDRPVASNTSADGRARNRRIEFRVTQ
ncbi:MAG: hypothetical protein RLZZ618_567 [Pseudomonadota bacterium]